MILLILRVFIEYYFVWLGFVSFRDIVINKKDIDFVLRILKFIDRVR